MKTGIVKALALSGKGNKIFRSGDAVKESNFPEGNWIKLVSECFINEDLVEVAEAAPSDENSKPAFDDISKKEIIAQLKEAGVDVNEKLSKQKLYDLL